MIKLSTAIRALFKASAIFRDTIQEVLQAEIEAEKRQVIFDCIDFELKGKTPEEKSVFLAEQVYRRDVQDYLIEKQPDLPGWSFGILPVGHCTPHRSHWIPTMPREINEVDEGPISVQFSGYDTHIGFSRSIGDQSGSFVHFAHVYPGKWEIVRRPLSQRSGESIVGNTISAEEVRTRMAEKASKDLDRMTMNALGNCLCSIEFEEVETCQDDEPTPATMHPLFAPVRKDARIGVVNYESES